MKENHMSKSNTGPSRSARPPATNPSTTRRPVGTRTPRPTAATFRSRHPVVAALAPVGLVVAAVATMVVIKAATGGSSPSSAAAASHLTAQGSASSVDPGTSPLSATVLASLSVSPATLDAVGSPGSVVPPNRADGSDAIGRGADGKPLITYIGAEYCPYCAAERWALAVALTRFGTFSNLSGTHSSGADVYPDTQTLSFYGASYTSPYVDFQAVEEATNQEVDGTYQTLQTPTAAESSLLSADDPDGSIPFVDIGNTYMITGASYSPQVLQGLTQTQIAAQLNDASSPVAQAIDGTANNITAAICKITGNQPASVCNSPAIAAIAKNLGA
jgi:hypothetical protein